MTGFTGSAPRAGIFLRVETDPLIALWCGFGDYDAPANALDLEGQRYQCLGMMAGIPAVQQLLNGAAERVTFALSGVPEQAASLADAESSAIQGKPVNLGVQLFDDDWAPSGDMLWIWEGLADILVITLDREPEGERYGLELSVATAEAFRKRASNETWTDAQHQRRHPGDTVFDQMPSGETTRVWPGG